MATVRDLYTKVSEETTLEFEECRHLCRTMQQAGLLPKGRRGGWKDAPEITHADCARFMVALAVTRTSGSRTVERVRERVENFSALIWRDPPGYRETLLERLVMIVQYEMDLTSISPMRIAFWDDDVWPTVEMEYGFWTVGAEPVEGAAIAELQSGLSIGGAKLLGRTDRRPLAEGAATQFREGPDAGTAGRRREIPLQADPGPRHPGGSTFLAQRRKHVAVHPEEELPVALAI